MKKYSIAAAIALTLTACNDASNYSITESAVGPLSKTATVNELSSIFANDSLVDDAGNSDFRIPQGDVTVYEKGGTQLLKLTPQAATKDATIKTIQVLDNRFETSEGLSLQSTFKDIQSAHTIRSIENFIGSIIILVDDSDVYFTIDKKHLPGDLMFDTNAKIELSQIPDDAPIKYLQIGWE